MEKFLENIQEAEKKIKTADHLAYITYPLLKDKRLFLVLLSEIKKSLICCINSILRYDYLYKRVSLSPDTKTNFETFLNKSSKRFQITPKELEQIKNIFQFEECHRKSSMEIMKEDKILILSPDLKQKIITIEQIKEFLQISKSILEKTKNTILRKI